MGAGYFDNSSGGGGGGEGAGARLNPSLSSIQQMKELAPLSLINS